MCVLNMHCICYAKNFEIQYALTKDRIKRLPGLHKNLIDINAEMASLSEKGCKGLLSQLHENS